MNKFIWVVVILLFYSCRDAERAVTQEKITFEPFLIENLLIGKPYYMTMFDNYLLIADKYADSLLCNIDLENRTFRQFGRIGQGPNEFLTFDNFYKWNGQLGFFDHRSRTCAKILFDDNGAARIEKTTKISTLDYNLSPTVWNTFIAIGPYEKGRFRLLDGEGQQIKMLGEQPYRDKEERVIPELGRAMAYQGEIAVSPSGDRLVDAIFGSPMIYFYELSADTVRQLKSHIECWPTYIPELHGDFYAAAMSRHNKFGYIELSVTARYVYALYSGQTTAEHPMSSLCGHSIRVFDWDGNLLKEYLFDIDLRAFCVSDDDATVYAIGLSDDFDDYELVRGKMNHAQ